MTSQVLFFDTHSHLCSTQFDDDRADVLVRMQAHGVHRHLEIAYSLESAARVLAFVAQTPSCWAVVGVQPNHPEDALIPDWLDQLHQLAQHPRVVAIGEIGFDHHYQKAPVATQEHIFRAQIALAAELHLPIVIHSREAHADTLRVLQDVRHPYGVVLHSFAGDVAYAEECVALGCVLSLSGPITFRNNHPMHDVVRQIDVAHLLIETDSPYLAPHPYRGKRNEPTYVIEVARQIAMLKNMPIEHVARQTWQTASTLFGIRETP
jgi:TatD DNase family protein